ncbi:penicillin acylase family protein [Burkholderia stagnalis]
MAYTDVPRRILILGFTLLAAAASASCSWRTTDRTAYHTEIRRDEGGVPHIVANDWGSLGYGYGYTQASDNLCTMAEAFVTYRGERSRYFGPDGAPRDQSTLGRPRNLDADFFFRLVDTDDVATRFRDSQPPALRALVRGFAAGYDRYLHDIRSGRNPGAHLACRAAPWLTPITEADVYRRLYAAELAGGFSRFVAEIANARPPAAGAPAAATDRDQPRADTGLPPAAQLADRMAVGGRVGIGSNALAFGADGSATGQPVLLGNPHWYWAGPDRFYEARLTLPGKLDVSGASLLGVPVVMIGFNRDVAWTHTVSNTRRFGFFELSLVPGQPTAYRYDGKTEEMTAVPLSVDAKQPDGTLKTVRRTLYRTRFGPVADLGSLSPALAWSGAKAIAVADVNADNFRAFENFFEWGQARSLDQFIDTQKRFAAMPWVNTVAIARDDPRVWYADIGAVPDVPDALADACTTPAGRAFDRNLPGVPFLDGSRSACEWVRAAGAAQAGAFRADDMPSLIRRDYVANTNNSYWLANPDAPIARHPAIFGLWEEPVSLRTRLGNLIARERIAGADGYPGKGATSDTLRELALRSDAMSARLFKAPLLDAVCTTPSIVLRPAGGKTGAPRTVDIRDACRTLRAWRGTGAVDDHGAVLWDEVWDRVEKIDAGKLYAIPFRADAPLATPRGLKADATADLSQAFGAAVAAMNDSGRPLGLSRGDAVAVADGSARIPLYGGCDSAGYFTSACTQHDAPGGTVARGDLLGNTYLQVVTFGPDGAHAYAMLAPSQSDDPASPYHADGTRLYGRQQWTDIRIGDASSHRTQIAPPLVLDGAGDAASGSE